MPRILLRPHFLSIRNRLNSRSSNCISNIQILSLVLVLFLIISCTFLSVYLLLSGLTDSPVVQREIINKLIDLSCTGLFILILLSTIIAAIGNFYAAENNFLLLSLPIPSAQIFIAKFLETFIETTIMLYIFCIPALVALATAIDLSLVEIIKVLIISEIFLIIPSSLAIVIATVAAEIIHRIWTHGKFFVALLSGASIFVIGKLAHLIFSNNTGTVDKFSFIRGLESPTNVWLPSYWLAEAIKDLLWEDYWNWIFTFPLLVLAIISIFIAFVFYRDLRHIAREATLIQDSNSHNHTGIFNKYILLYINIPVKLLRLSKQTKAIARKDLFSLLRDKAQAIQLILLLSLSAIYLTIFNSFSNLLALQSSALQVWSVILAALNILFTGVVITTIMTRLVFPSISLEGKCFTLLQSAPLDLSNLLKIKSNIWLPLSLIISAFVIITGLIVMDAPLLAYIWGILLCLFLSSTLTRVATSIGAIYAKFDWESVNQIHVGFGTLTLFATSLFYSLMICLASAPVFIIAICPELIRLIGKNPFSLMLLSSTFLFFALEFLTQSIFNKGQAHLSRIAIG